VAARQHRFRILRPSRLVCIVHVNPNLLKPDIVDYILDVEYELDSCICFICFRQEELLWLLGNIDFAFFDPFASFVHRLVLMAVPVQS